MADLKSKEFKLKSGKIVNLRLLRPMERGKVSDIARAYSIKYPELKNSKHGEFSMEALTQAVIFASDDELLLDWENEDIIAVGIIVLSDNFASEIEKKS